MAQSRGQEAAELCPLAALKDYQLPVILAANEDRQRERYVQRMTRGNGAELSDISVVLV